MYLTNKEQIAAAAAKVKRAVDYDESEAAYHDRRTAARSRQLAVAVDVVGRRNRREADAWRAKRPSPTSGSVATTGKRPTSSATDFDHVLERIGIRDADKRRQAGEQIARAQVGETVRLASGHEVTKNAEGISVQRPQGVRPVLESCAFGSNLPSLAKALGLR